jgi:polar amino acid transport system substrate-binding protein
VATTAWRRWTIVAMGVALVVGAAACGDDDDDDVATDTTGAATDTTAAGSDATAAPGDAVGSPECATDQLTLVSDGQLTVGTDTPAFPPWFVDDDPTNGQGFESAVAYAVAAELGFSSDQVVWTTVPFNSAFAPGEKDFDFDINQVSINDERDQAVDFSDGYYDVNQALVGLADSPAIGATTIADLQGLRLGAQVGTTSLSFITDVIQPDEEPQVYNDNTAVKAALDAGQVDAVVFDLPTAFYVSAVEIEGSSVIGQFPSTGDEPEQFGLVFAEGNPLRDCVNEALARMEESGTLAAIEQEWLSDVVDAPVIALE